MKGDHVYRLTALYEEDPKVAIGLLISETLIASAGGVEALLQDAAQAFESEIEEAIFTEARSITLSLERALMLSLAMKPRKRAAGRPRLSAALQATNNATVALARSLSKAKRLEGVEAGLADEEAAKEASKKGGVVYGSTLSFTTILRRMGDRGKKRRV